MTHFVEDDPGYFGWLEAHPQGRVINCYRTPTPNYLVLHRATCPHIQRYEGYRSTHDYGKVCADIEQELLNWATNLGGTVTRCRTCQP